MNLSERLARSAPGPADLQAAQPAVDAVHTFTAEFYTAHRMVQADLTSPELRLSDHLNGSAPTVDVKPARAVKGTARAETVLAGTFGHLTKDRVLFAVPLLEPERPRGQGNAAWKPTVKRRCWAGLGPYEVSGVIHTEAGRDPRASSRLLDKQFLPITDVTVTDPVGESLTFPAIIANRFHLDALTLQDVYVSMGR